MIFNTSLSKLLLKFFFFCSLVRPYHQVTIAKPYGSSSTPYNNCKQSSSCFPNYTLKYNNLLRHRNLLYLR